MVSMLIISFEVSAVGNGTGLLDDDGDGILNKDDPDFERAYINQNDVLDDDGDGIPNGQDDDYVPTSNGSQQKSGELRNGVKKTAQTENKNEENVRNTQSATNALKTMNKYSDPEVGRKISQIANSYEQEYQQAITIEDQINERSGFLKFL